MIILDFKRTTKFFASISAVILALGMSVINGFCDTAKTQSGTPSSLTTGGDDMVSILIGIILLTVGTAGFIALKIRERGKEKYNQDGTL